jgi:hypothetical protein
MSGFDKRQFNKVMAQLEKLKKKREVFDKPEEQNCHDVPLNEADEKLLYDSE